MASDEEARYFEINRKGWDQRTEVHLGADFYDQEQFLRGRSSLKAIELPLLGELRDRSVLHLQCHFGLDTLSLARAGARALGVDFSGKAIDAARALADETGQDARFVCCDVYSLPEQLDERFDLVFVSYGAIGWLPDLERWAGVVSHFLKPGGRLVLAEFHPVVWMFDDEFRELKYSYFNVAPIFETETGSYADRTAPVTIDSVGWNHPLGDVLGALLARGLRIEHFAEYDYSPFECLQGMVEVAPGRYRIESLGDKIPMVYSLVATKPPHRP